MPLINGRALHHVCRVSNRAATMDFYRKVLLMKVLRHEEFTETCAAACNGPYDNRWSKTMVGYGDESTNFTIELTYNYGVKAYKWGNEFGGVTIKSSDVVNQVKSGQYPFEQQADGTISVRAPDGYSFFLIDEVPAANEDPIKFITYSSSNLAESIKYWHELLGMSVISQNNNSALLSYNGGRFGILFSQIKAPIDRAEAFGRIAFAVPFDNQPLIDELIKKKEKTILTPLVVLDTPGKASVRVIILADPDGHEICFVDEEGFSQLSEFDPKSEAEMDKFIVKDPFQV